MKFQDIVVLALLAFSSAVESSRKSFVKDEDSRRDFVSSHSNKKPEKRGVFNSLGYGNPSSTFEDYHHLDHQEMSMKGQPEHNNEESFFSHSNDQSDTGEFNFGNFFNNNGDRSMFNPSHSAGTVPGSRKEYSFGKTGLYGNGASGDDGGYDHPPVKTIYITKEVPVPYPVHVERQVPYLVKIPVDKPVPVTISRPYPVHIEKPVPFPVKVHVAKPYPVTIEKHVPYPVRVPVDKPFPVHVPKPYPVFIEKKVPFAVEKPVPYPVRVPVDRPYAVHIPVEKPIPVHIEKKIPYPVNIPVDKPYPVHVPKPYPVTVEKPVPYVVEKHIPYAIKVPVKVPNHNGDHNLRGLHGSGMASITQENSNAPGMSFNGFKEAFASAHHSSGYGSSSGRAADFNPQYHGFSNSVFDMPSDFEQEDTFGRNGGLGIGE